VCRRFATDGRQPPAAAAAAATASHRPHARAPSLPHAGGQPRRRRVLPLLRGRLARLGRRGPGRSARGELYSCMLTEIRLCHTSLYPEISRFQGRVDRDSNMSSPEGLCRTCFPVSHSMEGGHAAVFMKRTDDEMDRNVRGSQSPLLRCVSYTGSHARGGAPPLVICGRQRPSTERGNGDGAAAQA
jgi:hypothetical protein